MQVPRFLDNKECAGNLCLNAGLMYLWRCFSCGLFVFPKRWTKMTIKPTRAAQSSGSINYCSNSQVRENFPRGHRAKDASIVSISSVFNPFLCLAMNQRPTLETTHTDDYFANFQIFSTNNCWNNQLQFTWGCCCIFYVHSLKLSNLAPENRQLAPKGNVHLPTIDFLANYSSEKQYINVYIYIYLYYDIYIY